SRLWCVRAVHALCCLEVRCGVLSVLVAPASVFLVSGLCGARSFSLLVRLHRRAGRYIARFFFSSRRRHTRCYRDWSSDVCSSDLDCGAKFIRQFGLRAFRRPLTDTEMQRYSALLSKEARRSGQFLDGAQLVIEAMLDRKSVV